MLAAGLMDSYSQSTLVILGVGVAALSCAAYRLAAVLDRYSADSVAILGRTILAAIASTALVAATSATLRGLRLAAPDTRFANT